MSTEDQRGPLVLGPLLRHVDETSAAIWVETRDAGSVTVHAGEGEWTARTFGVHGHHYALVECTDLEPGSVTPYTVDVDGERVWPRPVPGLDLPPSVIPTLKPGKPLRMAFGSCRTSVGHDEGGNRTHGVDAMRAYALAMAGVTQPADELSWPDLILFLGDQVYADETTDEMQEFIASRRDIDEPPGKELKDYEEYAHLYALAWSDPANRWLLSTLPSSMIFDDHDVRDDWNTSERWRREMDATSWWHERIVAGLSSYWVYQHIGNLSPSELADDEIYAQVLAGSDGGGEELDLTEPVFDLARRSDRHPEVYRWSFRRDLGDVRLVVVDSRAARVLEPQHRSMLDPDEMRWLDEQLTGDVEHLLIGTSLPFMLPPGLHDLEAIDEVLAMGAHGRLVAEGAEKTRQSIDLEHWAAFNDGFVEVFDMVMQVARGERGSAPASVVFLSGDVHNSYVAEVVDARTRHGATSRVVQAVCSPIRNPMPRMVRVMMSAFARGLVRPMRFVAEHSKRVPDPAYPWTVTDGPWFVNCLAELTVQGRDLVFVWRGGEVRDGDDAHPVLTTVASVRLPAAG